MKKLIYLIMFLVISTKGFCQDSVVTEFSIAETAFGGFKSMYEGVLLDRAVTIPRERIQRLKSSDSTIKVTSNDWLTLYHAFNLANDSIDFSDSTFSFSQRVNNYSKNLSSYYNQHVVPLGIISKNATLIKDDAYSNGNLVIDTESASFSIASNINFNDISETSTFNCVAPLYDLGFGNESIFFIINENTIISDKQVSHLIFENIRYEINDLIELSLTNKDSIFKCSVFFTDGTSFTQDIQIYNMSEDIVATKSNIFTGGKHNYPQSMNLPSWADGADISYYKLRYGIIWGECNTTGKLRKPFFMLHGFRPTVLPFSPTLKKLYNTKFNYGGTQYGSDGLVDLLVKNGYDVVICRIDPGFLSIRQGGRLLRDFFINVVEPQKESIGSKYENIVLGFSMGGHYWRHMLMLMEHEHLNNGANYHHHTRMWIPTDSPLHGANNPLAHQFAAKSLAETPAGIPSFQIAYINMLTPGSQEQQRYDMHGVNGNDGAPHRFHQLRTNYNNELEQTFYLGNELTKYKGFPSATRNVAISVGSNSEHHYYEFNNIGTTYEEQSQVIGLLSTKKFDVKLNAASYRYPTSSSGAKEVFHRKITRKWHFNQNTNILVDDQFELYEWLEMDNCYGSYLNAIRTNVNVALRFNSLFGFTDYVYKENQVFVPTVSALGINPSFWPNDMRYNLKEQGLLFNTFNIQTGNESDHFGYPHLGRPNDYSNLTPMDAIYCNILTYKHIDLVDDDDDQNDQSILIDFLLNEIQPWYLDLQNQKLGEYARVSYIYKAKYEAKERLQMGSEITPKTPFGNYEVLENVDVEYVSEKEIVLLPGTHIHSAKNAHFYITNLCHTSQGMGKITNNNKSTIESNYTMANFDSNDTSNQLLLENKIIIYPNPIDNSFAFGKYNFDFESSIYTVAIYSIYGKNIIDESMVENYVLTKNLSSGGVYIVVLKENGTIISRTKIIKK